MEWRIREYREGRESSDLENIRMRMREMIDELEAEDGARVTAQEIVRDSLKELGEREGREKTSPPTAQEVVREGLEKRNTSEVDESHSIDKRVEAALDAIEAEDDFEERKRRAIESLKENLGELSQETTERDVVDETIEVLRAGTVSLVEGLDEALDKHMELKLRRGFEKEQQEAVEYLNGDRENKPTIERPSLIEKIEQLEMKRLYEEAHGNPPEVSFESMQDVDRLLKEHSENLPHVSEVMIKQCEVYFDVKGDWSKTRKELSEVYGICHTYMGDWRAGKDTPLMVRLRELEETRICREWAQTREALEFASDLKPSSLERRSTWEQTTLENLSEGRADRERVRELFENLKEMESWTNEELASVIKELFNDSAQAQEFVKYAELIDTGWEIQRIRELQEHIRSNQKELEELVGRELDNVETIRLAALDEGVYAWAVKTRGDELIGAYESQYFYFKEKGDIAKIVRDLQNRFQMEGTLYEAHKHSNRLLKELLSNDEVSLRGEPFNEVGQRLEGRVMRAYLDAMDMKLSDLEGRVAKVTGVSGKAGIENPKFHEGESLEILKAKLYATMVSDGCLRPDGVIAYYEGELSRIEKVAQIIGSCGDVELTVSQRKNVYETMIPKQIGCILMECGMIPGDKGINNAYFPEFVLNGS
jgi:hypothetical protein